MLVGQDLMYTLLQVSSIDFVVAASLASFHTLCLNEHCLSVLLVSGVVLGKHSVLMLLDHLDPGLFETLADEDLENRLDLEVKVEEVWVDVLHLDGLIGALFVRDVRCTRWPINVVIRLYLRLVDHIVTIVQLDPVMHRLHHLLLLLLLVDLRHLLLLLLLRVSLIITAIFASVHLLHLLLLFLLLKNQREQLQEKFSTYETTRLTFIFYSRFLRI